MAREFQRGHKARISDLTAGTDLYVGVQISGPIESRYWWNGRIETATEFTVTIKTRRDLYRPLEKLLLELHPYDQPEIMATAVDEVSAGYLRWLAEQVKEPAKDKP